MSDFKLDPSEIGSATWQRLSAHLKAQLDALRAQNDDPASTFDEVKTARLRGRIQQIKNILALGIEKRE